MTKRGNDRVRGDMARAPGHNPFFSLAQRLCDPHVLPEVKQLRRPENGVVRLALVSMPNVEYSRKEIGSQKKLPSGVDREDVRRTLGAVSHADSMRMLQAFREALTVALEDGANIV